MVLIVIPIAVTHIPWYLAGRDMLKVPDLLLPHPHVASHGLSTFIIIFPINIDTFAHVQKHPNIIISIIWLYFNSPYTICHHCIPPCLLVVGCLGPSFIYCQSHPIHYHIPNCEIETVVICLVWCIPLRHLSLW